MRSHPWLLALVAGCATAPTARTAALDEKQPIAGVGSRCEGGPCRCRGEGGANEPDGEGTIAAGQKRFELRLGHGVDPLTVTVEGRGSISKSTEEGHGECVYFDLPPGKHRVRLRGVAHNPDAGFSPTISISEYGAETRSWYDTFRFRCGAGEPCTKDDVQDWVESLKSQRRGILDPCGSVRIEGARWSTERSPGARLSDLTVDFILDVYKFTPRQPTGSTCGPHRLESPSSPE